MARNQAHKRNSGRWCLSRPLARLCVLAACMRVMDRQMLSTLHMASKAWEHEQQRREASGQPRAFRVVEASSQRDLEKYFAGMMLLFLCCPEGLESRDKTLATRAYMSRIVSRAVCSLHQLLRVRRNAYPYKLFQALQEDCYDDSVPECLYDELTSTVRKWHPEYNTAAAATLESLASILDLDISQIECRHALKASTDSC